jgi:6-pyruvoyl-tetrahydropterin synthase
MFKNTENIYQSIAEALMDSVGNNDWIEITLNTERTSSSHMKLDTEYLKQNGDIEYISLFDNDYGLFNLFEKLYQTMTAETDKHKWNRAKATLTNDGKLNIKFEWDQELADELKRLEDEYDPRWDDSLSQEEKDKKYKEMVKNGELPDLSGVIVKK